MILAKRPTISSRLARYALRSPVRSHIYKPAPFGRGTMVPGGRPSPQACRRAGPCQNTRSTDGAGEHRFLHPGAVALRPVVTECRELPRGAPTHAGQEHAQPETGENGHDERDRSHRSVVQISAYQYDRRAGADLAEPQKHSFKRLIWPGCRTGAGRMPTGAPICRSGLILESRIPTPNRTDRRQTHAPTDNRG